VPPKLFKLSVRLQGGPKRAAHSVAQGSAPPQRQAQSCGGTLTAPGRHSRRAEFESGLPKTVRVQGVEDVAGCRPAGPGRRGRGDPPGRWAVYGRRRRGWRRECVGPLLQAQGRCASQATALRAALDLGASATLGQESWAGRWPALTRCAPANPDTDSRVWEVSRKT
jgi:hypothetical protein